MHRTLLVFTALILFLTSLCGALGWERIIKPGDKLRLTCEEEPSLNREYTITKDGLILLSFVGAVEVGGLNEVEAAKRISVQLVDQRILKKATVALSFLDSTTKPVRVSGAVRVTGEIPFKDGLRLSDVLKTADPLSGADLVRVQITSDKGEKLTVDFTKVESAELPLKPGDNVLVPVLQRADDVLVLGGVIRPGAYRFEGPTSVRKAIESAGGLASLGDSTKVRHEVTGKPTVTLDLSDPGVDAPVASGDRIVVELLPVRRFVKVEGEINKPGTVAFTDGMTLGHAVREAGGVTARARTDRVSVFSLDGKDKKPSVYNLDKILKGYLGDVKLKPGDRIVVSRGRNRANLLTGAAGAALGLFMIAR